jgi:hypothetical protein
MANYIYQARLAQRKGLQSDDSLLWLCKCSENHYFIRNNHKKAA